MKDDNSTFIKVVFTENLPFNFQNNTQCDHCRKRNKSHSPSSPNFEVIDENDSNDNKMSDDSTPFNSPKLEGRLLFRKLKTIKFILKKKVNLFIDVINELFFNSIYSDNLDGNFISKYNIKEDNYVYMIERLLGKGVNEELLFKYLVSNKNIDKNSTHCGTTRTLSLKGCDCYNEVYGWNILINNTAFTLSYLIENCRIIQQHDEIEFRFEKL